MIANGSKENGLGAMYPPCLAYLEHFDRKHVYYFRMSTAVYIDAFNLYYGSLKGTDCKWLDLSKMMSLLLPNQNITEIRYFTAKISAKPYDPGAPLRQQAYLSALETLGNVSIHYGRYQSNIVKMPLANPARGQSRMVEVIKSEEKGSDVNLATHLLVDAFAPIGKVILWE